MPPADAAVVIARAPGVSVEYLITGAEPMFPKDIRQISRDLLKLNGKDRKFMASIVKVLLEQREEPELFSP